MTRALILTLKRPWSVPDATSDDTVTAIIPAGSHEVERIPNPCGGGRGRGHRNSPWLVLKGTKIGMAEGAWRQWENGAVNEKGEPTNWGDSEVVITESEASDA